MRETYRNNSSAGLEKPCRTPPSRPADARRAVRRVVHERCAACAYTCDAGAIEDALLVTSELTTNAILHGGGITDFDVDVDSVSVSDRSDELPVAAAPADDYGYGRSRLGGRGWPSSAGWRGTSRSPICPAVASASPPSSPCAETPRAKLRRTAFATGGQGQTESCASDRRRAPSGVRTAAGPPPAGPTASPRRTLTAPFGRGPGTPRFRPALKPPFRSDSAC